jgi:hypothetical protein
MSVLPVVPAYGRDYAAEEEILADWKAGLDFQVGHRPGEGPYVNKDDMPPGKDLVVLFDDLSQIMIIDAATLSTLRLDVKAYQFHDADGNAVCSPWTGVWLLEDARRAELDYDLRLMDPQPVLSLAEQVRAYARGHYECGGWDVIVESWTDAQVAGALLVWDHDATESRQPRDLAEALTRSVLAACVSIWKDRQADARNNA